ncbi:hypothetical protein FHS96_001920 [Sphingomonas zeicaulis]|uniref:hypothetical protein n=1 Tax=Sphingomonas zeicaulis TaxID=1632740 RepID=UPI003D1F2219
MASRTGWWMLIVAATALALPVGPVTTPAYAQGWDKSSSCRRLDGRDRERCERDRDRWDPDRNRRERERERRKDAKTDGIVAGVVGTAITGGIIAAAASKKNKDKGRDGDGGRDRRVYCEDRYGNYDGRSDSYRAADGRWYRCE